MPNEASPSVPVAEGKEQFWVLSNRVDDRAVLWERDALHPGGECFIASSTPALVGRTPEVTRLLHAGLIVEVPEPREGPKKPIPIDQVWTENPATQPGQVVRLGRKLDPDLFPAEAQKQVAARQAQLPQEIPVPAGVIVPPADSSTKETVRR